MNLNDSVTPTYFDPESIEISQDNRLKEINQHIVEKISDITYSCVGAKAAINSKQYRLGIYSKMGDAATTKQLGADLKKYISETVAAESEYMTLIAVFTEDVASEEDFEKKLWLQLQELHDSEKHETRWDPAVSNIPTDNDFSFSYDGTAFFIVGLHPEASRKARRFNYTAMAFNLHRQFEQLREKGIYENMKNVIRDREVAYDGSINPMLQDFGDGQEAPQYSGRLTDKSWQCPFKAGFNHQQ